MARLKRRKAEAEKAGLPVVHRHAAGLGIGSTFHMVGVPPERDSQPVRAFRSFTGDLHRLADWLEKTGITTVAMESTGVYWIAVYEILEARGFEGLASCLLEDFVGDDLRNALDVDLGAVDLARAGRDMG